MGGERKPASLITSKPTIAFFLVLAIHLAGIVGDIHWLELATKPLLVPLVAFFYLQATKGQSRSFSSFFYGALFFSLAGDVLLMFQGDGALFFMLGLGSFLVAQVCYLLLFVRISIKEHIKRRPIWNYVVGAYAGILLALLWPFLGDMKWPVSIYAFTISFMLNCSLQIKDLRPQPSGRFIMFGAVLFVASDSLLAINKFYHPFPLAGFFIMLTYGLAQFFIAAGFAKYGHQHPLFDESTLTK